MSYHRLINHVPWSYLIILIVNINIIKI